MKHIYILDIGYGNLKSLHRFFSSFGSVSYLFSPSDFTPIAYELSVLVLPGVGSFSSASIALRSAGFFSFFNSLIGNPNVLIIGICLGMQLLSTSGYEGGFSNGLNIIPGSVVPLTTSGEMIMGWQPLINISPLLKNMSPFNIMEPYFYFAHSFKFSIDDPSLCLAYSDYLGYPSIVFNYNFLGLQFHPELSQRSGHFLVSSFLEYFFK